MSVGDHCDSPIWSSIVTATRGQRADARAAASRISSARAKVTAPLPELASLRAAAACLRAWTGGPRITDQHEAGSKVLLVAEACDEAKPEIS